MRGFSRVLWVLLVIVLNQCESIKNVNLSGTRMQAPDKFALPRGYTIFPDHNVAYKVYFVHALWDTARAVCKLDGGDLAIVESKDQIQSIRNINVLEDASMFVGIYKPAGEESWHTVKDEYYIPLSPTLALWVAVSDQILEYKDCAAIKVFENDLESSPCDMIRPFVCEIPYREHQEVAEVTTTTTPATTTLTPTIPPPPPPPQSPLLTIATTSDNSSLQSVEFPRLGILYKFHGDRLTHHEARKGCFADGGRLAVVDSFEKINVISKILNEEPVHVGIRVSSINFEEWVGDSDGVPLKDLPWTADNPHPARCAALRKDGSGLEETLCSNQLHYLCEIRKIND